MIEVSTFKRKITSTSDSRAAGVGVKIVMLLNNNVKGQFNSSYFIFNTPSVTPFFYFYWDEMSIYFLYSVHRSQILFDQSHLMLPLHFMLPVILYWSLHSLPFNLPQKILLFSKIDTPDTELLVLPLISPILFIFCYILKICKWK